jgi:hypothetical protein
MELNLPSHRRPPLMLRRARNDTVHAIAPRHHRPFPNLADPALTGVVGQNQRDNYVECLSRFSDTMHESSVEWDTPINVTWNATRPFIPVFSPICEYRQIQRHSVLQQDCWDVRHRAISIVDSSSSVGTLKEPLVSIQSNVGIRPPDWCPHSLIVTCEVAHEKRPKTTFLSR